MFFVFFLFIMGVEFSSGTFKWINDKEKGRREGVDMIDHWRWWCLS